MRIKPLAIVLLIVALSIISAFVILAVISIASLYWSAFVFCRIV